MPWRSTSSAILNACIDGASCDRPAAAGVVGDGDQRVHALPQLARCPLRRRGGAARPRTSNGLVTTPTVSAPDSWAIWATIGAAPVPVPPPMPAVMNTMSAPRSRSAMLLGALFGGALRRLRVAARAQAAGELLADADAVRRLGLAERLRVGVDGDELDAAHARLDHAVDGVAAAAADADDLDLGEPTGLPVAGASRMRGTTGSSGLAAEAGRDRNRPAQPRSTTSSAEGQVASRLLAPHPRSERRTCPAKPASRILLLVPISVREHQVAPAVPQVLCHGSLLAEAAVELAQQDAQHREPGIEIGDLLDTLLEHLETL